MKKSAIRREYTAVDLFSGCGGLSFGLKKAGFVVRAAVEIDPVAAFAYRKNHSGTVVLEKDIRKVEVAEVMRAANLGKRALDLLVGCPPCQGFSRIRRLNKKGVRDPRNRLVNEFARLALGIRPKMILMENVPGLARDWRFKRVLRDFRAAGYSCRYSVLNAADFGVPQRRKRLILIASRVGTVELPEGGKRGVKTVRKAIGKLKVPQKSNDALHRMCLHNSAKIKKLIERIPSDGGGRNALGPRRQLACHKKVDGFRDVYGRMKWDDVAPTLTGGCFNPSKGRFLHPKQNRPITMREAARLQSFPAAYRFPVEYGLTAVARLIGDALPPAFAYRQGKHLLKLLAKR